MRQSQTQFQNKTILRLFYFKKYVQYSLEHFNDYRLSMIHIIHPVSNVKGSPPSGLVFSGTQANNKYISQTTKL